MAVTISKVDSYKRYGRCVKLENDAVELLITLDLGPRIIYYAAKGGENLFFNDEEDQVVDRSPFFKELFGACRLIDRRISPCHVDRLGIRRVDYRVRFDPGYVVTYYLKCHTCIID